MFKSCKSLLELNAERGRLVTEGVDITTINNAYNARRQELLSQRKPFTEVKPIKILPREVQQFMGIPIAGKSPISGVITLTENGFLY